MLRKVLVIIALTAITISCISGCKKRSAEDEPEQITLKTMAEYEAEAKKQITKKNMASELDKMEKAIDQELNAEQ